eukprot:403339208
MAIKFEPSIEAPLIYSLQSKQTETEANVVVSDESMSYQFYGGALYYSQNQQMASITILDRSGAQVKTHGINLQSHDQTALPFAVKKLNYQKTGTSQCLVACASDNQYVVFMKFNVVGDIPSLDLQYNVQTSSQNRCIQVQAKGENCQQLYYLASNEYKIQFATIDFDQKQYKATTQTFTADNQNKFNDGYFIDVTGYYVGQLSSYLDGWIQRDLIPVVGMIMSTNSTFVVIAHDSDILTLLSTNLIDSQQNFQDYSFIMYKGVDFNNRNAIVDLVSQLDAYTILICFQKSIKYIINSEKLEVEICEFQLQEMCTDVQFTYELIYDPKLIGVINFITSNRTMFIESSNVQLADSYNLTVKAKINNGQTQQTTIMLELVSPDDPCLSAVINQVNSPQNTNYVIKVQSPSPTTQMTLNFVQSSVDGCKIKYNLEIIDGTRSTEFHFFDDDNLQLKFSRMSFQHNFADKPRYFYLFY